MKAIYPKFKKALLSGGSNINLMSGNIKMMLIDTDLYTYDPAHEFLTDVPSGARIATSANLSGKTLSDFADLDFDDPTFPSVEGTELEAILLVVDTGVEATTRLVAFQGEDLIGMPITPDGTNVKLVVNPAGFMRL